MYSSRNENNIKQPSAPPLDAIGLGSNLSDINDPPPSYSSVAGRDRATLRLLDHGDTGAFPTTNNVTRLDSVTGHRGGYDDTESSFSTDNFTRIDGDRVSSSRIPETTYEVIEPVSIDRETTERQAAEVAAINRENANHSYYCRNRHKIRRSVLFLSFVLGVGCIVLGSVNMRKCNNKFVPAFPLVLGICFVIQVCIAACRDYSSLGNFSSLVLMFFIAASIAFFATTSSSGINYYGARGRNYCQEEAYQDTFYLTIVLCVFMAVFWFWACRTCCDKDAFFCDDAYFCDCGT